MSQMSEQECMSLTRGLTTNEDEGWLGALTHSAEGQVETIGGSCRGLGVGE